MSKYDPIQSIVSYGTGVGGVMLAQMNTYRDALNDFMLFGGAVLLVVRLAYDGLKLYRSIKNKDVKGE